MEEWLAMTIVKESDSTRNFWGFLRMSESWLSDDSEGKGVKMILGRRLNLGHLLPIRTVCPLLFEME